MASDTPITKDEFRTALEVQAKATEQMVLIATALKEITEQLRDLHDRLYNGAVSEIVLGVSTNYNTVHKETIADLKTILKNQDTIMHSLDEKVPGIFNETLTNSDIAKDIGHVKWFVGVVGFIIIVASVILNGIQRTSQFDTSIQHLLKQHIEQTDKLLK